MIYGNWRSARDGAMAEVVAGTEDGEWVKVKYVECEERPGLVGTEDLTHADEISHIRRP